jgi:enamine deaminase RidA (YjgF/YER057c/UK114 family)
MTLESAHEVRRGAAIIPEIWREFYDQTHIPAAIRTDDLLRVTGHTGETPDGAFSDDAEAQIRQTFQNISVTLSEGGSSWASPLLSDASPRSAVSATWLVITAS